MTSVASKKKKRTHKRTGLEMPMTDKMRLALEAGRTVRCVEAVLEGRSKPLPTQCVLAAAKRLGLELPEGAGG